MIYAMMHFQEEFNEQKHRNKIPFFALLDELCIWLATK